MVVVDGTGIILKLMSRNIQKKSKGLSRFAIQSLLPNLKKENEWLTDAYSQCLQSVALNLSTAYKIFFEKRGGFPKQYPYMADNLYNILQT